MMKTQRQIETQRLIGLCLNRLGKAVSDQEAKKIKHAMKCLRLAMKACDDHREFQRLTSWALGSVNLANTYRAEAVLQ